MKQVMTVLGPIDPGDLGETLMHEHLFVDLRNWLVPPKTPEEVVFADRHVTTANLDRLRRDPLRSKDNLVLDDLEMMIEEAANFKRSGGGTIVEVTLTGIGRDPVRLKQLSSASSLNIICGCGYYVGSSHPPHVSVRTKAELAAEMIRDLTERIGETGIRAGIIGEIGLSPGILPDEEKVLRAAVIAARETGAALSIHPPWPRGERLPILDILIDEGADLTRVILCHMDNNGLDADTHQAIADKGVYLEYDTLGKEYCRDAHYGFNDPLDSERVAIITEMVRRGYVAQILLSQDVCKKTETCRYGGRGYAHIGKNIVQMLTTSGVTAEQIRTMRVG